MIINLVYFTQYDFRKITCYLGGFLNDPFLVKNERNKTQVNVITFGAIFFIMDHVSLRDVFHISLVIGPRSDVLAWGAADLGPITRPIWKTPEHIRIGLVFAVLTQWKFLYCIDRFDHIKANKSKLINNNSYYSSEYNILHKRYRYAN
jgi:hypothetical protein